MNAERTAHRPPAVPGRDADQVKVEVIRHGLHSAAEQMKRALIRTAFSPIIYDVLDFAVAIYDRRFRLLSQAPGLPNFLGTMAYCVEGAVEEVGGESALEPGDVLLYNYPYRTGSHQEDVAVVFPVYLASDDLIGYTTIKAHWLDIGGKDFFATDTVHYLQEGIIFPGVKLYAGGRLNRDMFRMVTANSRVPAAVAGDLHAEVAGVRTGAAAFLRVVERHGLDVFEEAVERMFDHGESRIRDFVSSIPDGSYVARGEMDNDGLDDEPIPFEIVVDVAGSHITVDYSRAPDARPGPVNSPLPSTISATRVAISMLASVSDSEGDGHFHEGHFRPIKVVTRPGSLFHPLPPAPCWLYYPADYQAIEVIFRALAEALPEVVPAGSGGDVTTLIWWGVREQTGIAWGDGSGNPIGHGAFHAGDGQSSLMHYGEASTRITPVEVWEAKNPWLFERLELAADSCGPGKYRGGLGVDMFIHMLEDCRLTCALERTKNAPWGLRGGGEGRPNSANIRYDDGRREPLAKSTAKKIPKGTTFELSTGGGGGWGAPSARDPALVQADVEEGYTTKEEARRHYPHAFPKAPDERRRT
jgi:N-methylhydantoinase B